MKRFKLIGNTNVLTGSLLIAMLGLSQIAVAETKNNNQQAESPPSQPSFQPPNTENLAPNEINLIFVRPLDNDNLQTTANIGVDGRFHTSLKPGQYSQLRYCSGQHNISVGLTSLKTNDFTNPYSHLVNFPAQQNHFIYVDIDDTSGEPKLSKLNPSYALQLLSTQSEQDNKISRVVADCPPVVKPKPKPEIKVEIDKPINLKVLFEFDKAVVKPEFNYHIEAVAKFMKKYPDTTTVIEGHTDSIGKDSYNMDLSKRRAEAVKQELVSKYNIDPTRLKTQGFGETQPVDTNATKEGRHNNRRVVATVSASK